MAKAQLVWWGAIGFLAGLAAAGLGWSLWLTLGGALAILCSIRVLWGLPSPFFLLIPLALLFGAGYAGIHNHFVHGANILPVSAEVFEATVTTQPRATKYGAWAGAELSSPHHGELRLWWSQEHSFRYGDSIVASGELDITGKVPWLFIDEVVGHQPGKSSFRKKLFLLKEQFLAPYHRMPGDVGALAAGITFGQRQFSDQFEAAMRASGTTHLVALSGYNIAILVAALFGLLVGNLPRRLTFLITTSVIALFVLMVGGEASIVRAAIMGALGLLAREVGRMYSFSRGVVYAALVMALWDPGVLFDIGFQLSFVSLLGIGYLLPKLQLLWDKISRSDLLGLREHVLTTASAQFAVMPLLFIYFGSVSPSALVANALILPAMPLTMALSFLYTGLANVWWPLAFVVGKAAEILLAYEVGVIYLFG